MSFFYTPVLPASAELLSAPAAVGYIKVWNGTQWTLKPVKYWNGSQWVQKPMKYWNGSQWTLTPSS